MNISDIIRKKRAFGKLTKEEIKYAVSSFTAGKIADYQMAALLMAICLNGLTFEETCELTRAMVDTGATLDLSSIAGKKIDKHSTGGVGDGTSLVIAPLVASAGVVVPMMAGRGLEHTGGTIDKLESIPNFKTALNKDEFMGNLRKIGVAICGQTNEIAPADDKMYALRDVTGTVDSIPLIASSIMSKKLAEGSDGLVLDVKAGSGGFSKCVPDAKKLAREMIKIAESFGKKAVAIITDMSQPLGNAVGNSLEVIQAIEVMKGKGPEDFRQLVIALSLRMLILAGEKDIPRLRQTLEDNLSNGKALGKFREMVECQHGDARVVDNPEKILPGSSGRIELRAPRKGFVDFADTRNIGIAANLLGAGRFVKEDKIDFGSGIKLSKKRGDYVEEDEPVATFYFNNDSKVKEAELRFWEGMKVVDRKPKRQTLILAEIWK